MLARCGAALQGAGGRAALTGAWRVAAAAAAAVHSASLAAAAADGGAAAAAAAAPVSKEDDHMDFPGGSVPFTSQLSLVGGSFSPRAPMPCYRCVYLSGGGNGGERWMAHRPRRCGLMQCSCICLRAVLLAGDAQHQHRCSVCCLQAA